MWLFLLAVVNMLFLFLNAIGLLDGVMVLSSKSCVMSMFYHFFLLLSIDHIII